MRLVVEVQREPTQQVREREESRVCRRVRESPLWCFPPMIVFSISFQIWLHRYGEGEGRHEKEHLHFFFFDLGIARYNSYNKSHILYPVR